MTRRPWEPEIKVTVEAVRRVVAEQLPSLSGHEPRLIGYGWDNDAYLVGHHVLRFPRRQIAVDMVLFEAEILRLLPQRLHLSVPRLELLGVPSEVYPHQFLVYQMVEGTSACDINPPYAPTEDDAVALGSFLKAAHNVPCQISDTIRGDTMRKADVPFRLGKIEGAISQIDESHLPASKEQLVRAARELATSSPCTEIRLVHGDLYARHVLVSDQKVSGVIDWGDAHIGDPALDLSIAYTLLNADTEQAFFDAYGPVDEATRRRSMFRALFYCAVLVDFGVGNQDQSILSVGQHALTRVLESL